MAQRLSALLIWAVVAACTVFWGLRLGATPVAAPAAPTVSVDSAAPRADLSRLLGAPLAAPVAVAPPPVAESTRFRLLGVIAGGHTAGGGVALLVVDGKPPRAYRVGAVIDAGLVVQSVTRRGVAIGPPGAPASVSLELPPPPAPATGEPLRLAPDGSVIGGAASPGAAGLSPAPLQSPPPLPPPSPLPQFPPPPPPVQMPFPPPPALPGMSGMPGVPGVVLQAGPAGGPLEARPEASR